MRGSLLDLSVCLSYYCKVASSSITLLFDIIEMTESKAISRLGQVKDFLTGHKTATTIPFDPNCTKFPSRKDVPRREGAPDEA